MSDCGVPSTCEKCGEEGWSDLPCAACVAEATYRIYGPNGPGAIDRLAIALRDALDRECELRSRIAKLESELMKAKGSR